MARVQYGTIITNMRGSIGGVTFSSAGGVNVAKRKALPPKPRRPDQVPQINGVRRWAPRWRLLTVVQKAQWILYGTTVPLLNSLGQTYYLGGFQTYVKYAQFANARGLSGSPVLPSGFGAPSVPTAVFSEAAGDVTLDSLTPAAAGTEVIAVTLLEPTPASINTPRGRVHSTWNGDGTGLPVTIGTDYGTNYATGTVLNGWVQWRWMDSNGRLSTLITESFQFTA